jgi:integrase
MVECGGHRKPSPIGAQDADKLGRLARVLRDKSNCVYVPKLDTNEARARPPPSWPYELIEKHAREDMRRAIKLARNTGQRPADILRMAPEHVEDGGINVQQKTGKELWLPLHADLKAALETRDCSPYVRFPKGAPYTAERFRAAWTRLMNEMPGRGLHVPWAPRVERGETTRSGMRTPRD